ncbi:profilin-4 [Diretmus argenteus]
MNQYQALIDDCLIHTKHVENAALLVVKNALITAASPRCQDGHGLIIVTTLLYVLVATYNNDMYPMSISSVQFD